MNPSANLDIKEHLEAKYLTVSIAVKDMLDGTKTMDRIIDQFYYNISKIDDNNKDIVIGQFIYEMAKAICYVLEDPIDEDLEYMVLKFNDIDNLSAYGNCKVRVVERTCLVYNVAMQPIGVFPDRSYIYRHEESLRYIGRFINRIKELYTASKALGFVEEARINNKSGEIKFINKKES